MANVMGPLGKCATNQRVRAPEFEHAVTQADTPPVLSPNRPIARPASVYGDAQITAPS